MCVTQLRAHPVPSRPRPLPGLLGCGESPNCSSYFPLKEAFHITSPTFHLNISSRAVEPRVYISFITIFLVFNVFETLWMPSSYLTLLKTVNAAWHSQTLLSGSCVCRTRYLIIMQTELFPFQERKQAGWARLWFTEHRHMPATPLDPSCLSGSPFFQKSA